MKRIALAVLGAALWVASPSPARADSGRWGSFEIAAGTYKPNIDSEFASRPGPYEQIFGTSRGWMFRLGASKSLWTRVGSLEVGLRTGFFQRTGKAMSRMGGSTPTFEPSGDATAFRIIPTSVDVTYRFDFLAERYHIPLAPYGRISFERYNWWTSGAGQTTHVGATNGWSATAGLALLLDILDPQMARELDNDTGINHTYLFADVMKTRVDDFGSSKSWDLSDTQLTLSFGLLFVF